MAELQGQGASSRIEGRKVGGLEKAESGGLLNGVGSGIFSGDLGTGIWERVKV